MVVFGDDERLSEPAPARHGAGVERAVGDRTHLPDLRARLVAADPVLIGVERDGVLRLAGQRGLEARPVVVGRDRSGIAHVAQRFRHARRGLGLDVDEEGLEVAHPRAALIAARRQRDAAFLKQLAERQPAPSRRQRLCGLVAVEQPGDPFRQQQQGVMRDARFLPQDAVELDAALIDRHHERQRRIVDRALAGVGIDGPEREGHQPLPVNECRVVDEDAQLEVRGRIPAVVEAAIAAAPRRKPVEDPADPVLLECRHQVVDAVERLGIEVEVLPAPEHQRGVHEMEAREVVAVALQLERVAVGGRLVREAARGRAPGERGAHHPGGGVRAVGAREPPLAVDHDPVRLVDRRAVQNTREIQRTSGRDLEIGLLDRDPVGRGGGGGRREIERRKRGDASRDGGESQVADHPATPDSAID